MEASYGTSAPSWLPETFNILTAVRERFPANWEVTGQKSKFDGNRKIGHIAGSIRLRARSNVTLFFFLISLISIWDPQPHDSYLNKKEIPAVLVQPALGS